MPETDWMEGREDMNKQPKTPIIKQKPTLDFEAIKKCVNEYLSRNLHSYNKMKSRPSAEFSEIVKWFERIKKLKYTLNKYHWEDLK